MASNYGFQQFGPYTAKHRKARVLAAAALAERDLYNLSTAQLTEIKGALTTARTEIVATLASAPQGTWQQAQQTALLTEVERQLRIFQGAATTSLSHGLNQAHDLGSVIPVKMLTAGGLTISIQPTISTAYLAAAQQYSAGLIKDVTVDTVREIERLLRQTALGSMSVADMIKAVGPVAGQGKMASAFHRAEAIVRTEMGRVSQTASRATLGELAKADDQLKKEWHSNIDSRTRRDHIAVNGQVRDVDDDFDVAGHKMGYPKDPRGPAKETVRCRCLVLPWHPAWNDGTAAATPVVPTFGTLPKGRPIQRPAAGTLAPAPKAPRAPRPASTPRQPRQPSASALARAQAASARAAARLAKQQAAAAAKAQRAAAALAARQAKAAAAAAAKAARAKAAADARAAAAAAKAAAKQQAAQEAGRTRRAVKGAYDALHAILKRQGPTRAGSFLHGRSSGVGDQLLARLHDEMGLGRPTVLPWDRLIGGRKAGERLFFRSVRNNPGHHDTFRYGGPGGETWMGLGVYGNGMYAAAPKTRRTSRSRYYGGGMTQIAFRESASYGQGVGRPDLVTIGVLNKDAKTITDSALKQRMYTDQRTLTEERRQHYRRLEADVVTDAIAAGALPAGTGIRTGLEMIANSRLTPAAGVTPTSPGMGDLTLRPYSAKLHEIREESRHDRVVQTALFEDQARYALHLGYDVILPNRSGTGSQYMNILNHSAVRLLDRNLTAADVAWINAQP